MKKATVLKIVFLIVTIALAWAIKWIDTVLDLMSCHEQIINQAASPTGQYSAQFIDIQCSAARGFAEGVKLVDKPDPYAQFKKMYQALLPGFYDAFYGGEGIVFTVDERPPIKLQWLNKNTLKISYPKATQVYIQNTRWHNVNIVYETL